MTELKLNYFLVNKKTNTQFYGVTEIGQQPGSSYVAKLYYKYNEPWVIGIFDTPYPAALAYVRSEEVQKKT